MVVQESETEHRGERSEIPYLPGTARCLIACAVSSAVLLVRLLGHEEDQRALVSIYIGNSAVCNMMMMMMMMMMTMDVWDSKKLSHCVLLGHGHCGRVMVDVQLITEA